MLSKRLAVLNLLTTTPTMGVKLKRAQVGSTRKCAMPSIKLSIATKAFFLLSIVTYFGCSSTERQLIIGSESLRPAKVYGNTVAPPIEVPPTAIPSPFSFELLTRMREVETTRGEFETSEQFAHRYTDGQVQAGGGLDMRDYQFIVENALNAQNLRYDADRQVFIFDPPTFTFRNIEYTDRCSTLFLLNTVSTCTYPDNYFKFIISPDSNYPGGGSMIEELVARVRRGLDTLVVLDARPSQEDPSSMRQSRFSLVAGNVVQRYSMQIPLSEAEEARVSLSVRYTFQPVYPYIMRARIDLGPYFNYQIAGRGTYINVIVISGVVREIYGYNTVSGKRYVVGNQF